MKQSIIEALGLALRVAPIAIFGIALPRRARFRELVAA